MKNGSALRFVVLVAVTVDVAVAVSRSGGLACTEPDRLGNGYGHEILLVFGDPGDVALVAVDMAEGDGRDCGDDRAEGEQLGEEHDVDGDAD